ATYRTKLRARRLQAVRQARYRERVDKFGAQKVTHQPMTEAAAPSMSSVALETSSGGRETDDATVREPLRCSVCGAPVGRWARRDRRVRKPAAVHRRAP